LFFSVIVKVIVLSHPSFSKVLLYGSSDLDALSHLQEYKLLSVKQFSFTLSQLTVELLALKFNQQLFVKQVKVFQINSQEPLVALSHFKFMTGSITKDCFISCSCSLLVFVFSTLSSFSSSCSFSIIISSGKIPGSSEKTVEDKYKIQKSRNERIAIFFIDKLLHSK
jgi:hypothetical protein